MDRQLAVVYNVDRTPHNLTVHSWGCEEKSLFLIGFLILSAPSCYDQSGRTSTNSSSTPANDAEQDLPGTPNNLNSISSLIGNHPLDDILYLHCARCQSSYGSVHAFRKHFRNSHGYMPTADDVLIQSIKATKEFVMNKNEYQYAGMAATPPTSGVPRRHCNYCGYQCEQKNPSDFSKHMRDHYDIKGCYYRCIYCQLEFSEPNTLKQHVVQHSTIYQHICSFCCIAYAVEEELTSHMYSHHGMRCASRKVNLPVSVVLPNPATGTPHSIADVAASKLTSAAGGMPRLKPGNPQAYNSSEHLQSKAPQGKMIGSPRLHSLTSPPGYYTHSTGTQAMPGIVMMPSPRYPDATAKGTSPLSNNYKKSLPTALGAMPRGPAPPSGLSADSHVGSINLMSMLDNAVEQGLKTTAGMVNYYTHHIIIGNFIFLGS